MVKLLEYFYLANLSQLIDFLVNRLQLMVVTPRAKLYGGLEILLHLNDFHCFVSEFCVFQAYILLFGKPYSDFFFLVMVFLLKTFFFLNFNYHL